MNRLRAPSRLMQQQCVIGLLMVLLLNLGGSTLAWAGTTGAIDAKTFRQLNKAKDLVADEHFDDALKVLDKLQQRKSVRGYAKAQVLNYQGYVYASKQSYRKAITSYQEVLKQEDVPEALVLNAHYVMGQLYLQLEQYADSIESLLRWKSLAKKPSSTGLMMLAQCYYLTGKYSLALPPLAIAIAQKNNTKSLVPESWLQLQAALYFALDDMKNTVTVYEMLLVQYPKARYLKQLAGLYGELGQKKKRLSTFDAAYEHGLLSLGSEQRNLANMYLEQGVPFKAAKLIDGAIKNNSVEGNTKNLRLLASIWALSGENSKAIDTYQQAAKLSDDGEIDARLAAVYYDAGDYQLCVTSANEANKKGGITNPGRNNLLLGLALVNLEKYSQALQAFRLAKDDKKTFDSAREWERYTLSHLALAP
ncbi:hypothetical protein A9Q99_27265 [Gammaproteobacteria bacterium 45_16_T64]|nr:hypothetical protein A9Q99_27265 [Gammaproteobacteria bacterium 45_16_T64]